MAAMRLVAIVILAVALVLAYLWWRPETEAGPGEVAKRIEKPRESGAPGTAGANLPATRALPAALPTGIQDSRASASAVLLLPLNTRVRDVITQLRADAERGVPQAACRLGGELTRCWQATQRLAIRQKMAAQIETVGPTTEQGKALSNAVNTQFSSTLNDAALCEGVTDDDTRDAWRFLLSGAMAGSKAAMAQFAVNPPLSTEDVIGSLDGWNAYREYAPGFLRRSIEAGNVRALYLGYFSAVTGLGPGGQAFGARDPYQALVYAQALLPLADLQTVSQIQAQIPKLQAYVPDRAQEAAREGEALRAKYFAGAEQTNVSAKLGVPRPEDCAQ